MDRLVPLTFALPLLGAAISLVAVRRLRVQRILNIACLAASLAVSVVLLVHVERTDTAAVAHIGAWPSDIGITYVLDRLSGMLLVIAFTTMLLVLIFAVGQRTRDEASPFYHPAYLVLAAGIAAAFCTGDLFHLFVAFEVLLMASYVLLTLHGRAGTGPLRHHLRHHQQRRVHPAAGRGGTGLRGHRHPQLRRPPRRARPPSTPGCAPGSRSCCSSPSGSRPRSSRSSSGCPTPTPPRPAR